MDSLKPIHIISIVVAVALAALGLFSIATYQAPENQAAAAIGRVEVWGVASERTMAAALEEIGQTRPEIGGVTYRQVDPETFAATLTAAIARGTGPDLLLLPHSLYLENRAVLALVPESVLSPRMLKDGFAAAAAVLDTPDGIAGIPVGIDPLMLYANRELLDGEGIAELPTSWEEVLQHASALSVLGADFRFTRSAVALGSYDNVFHAREILSTLFLQGGDVIVGEDDSGNLEVSLGSVKDGSAARALAPLRFYVEFANPAKAAYSWNAGMGRDFEEFLLGDLAYYFAPASEESVLKAANPNLDLAVGPVPQAGTATRLVVSGEVYAFMFPRTSDNQSGALAAAMLLSGKEEGAAVARALGMPSARRDILSGLSGDSSPAGRSALAARAWLVPGVSATNEIFSQAVTGITSGRVDVAEALGEVILGLRDALSGV